VSFSDPRVVNNFIHIIKNFLYKNTLILGYKPLSIPAPVIVLHNIIYSQNPKYLPEKELVSDIFDTIRNIQHDWITHLILTKNPNNLARTIGRIYKSNIIIRKLGFIEWIRNHGENSPDNSSDDSAIWKWPH
jgi:hypothetical protein